MRAILISDLHLHADLPDTQALAVRFLRESIPDADALYILGDLFDAWVGDDDPVTWAQPFLDAVTNLSNSGTQVHLMHGNRDFLLGDAFAQRVSATLHTDDELLIHAGDRRALIMHGDTLCTDDTEYLAAREIVRGAQWQRDFLKKSLIERHAEAAQLREKSRAITASKDLELTDANPAACAQVLDRSGADVLIHGHTHRPAVHDCAKGQRVVLGEWLAHGTQFAEFDTNGARLLSWPGGS